MALPLLKQSNTAAAQEAIWLRQLTTDLNNGPVEAMVILAGADLEFGSGGFFPHICHKPRPL